MKDKIVTEPQYTAYYSHVSWPPMKSMTQSLIMVGIGSNDFHGIDYEQEIYITQMNKQVVNEYNHKLRVITDRKKVTFDSMANHVMTCRVTSNLTIRYRLLKINNA